MLPVQQQARHQVKHGRQAARVQHSLVPHRAVFEAQQNASLKRVAALFGDKPKPAQTADDLEDDAFGQEEADFEELEAQALAAERKAMRQSCWVPGRIIHPAAPSKLRWDMLLLAMILYSLWMIPWQVSFDVDSSTASQVMDLVVDFIFALDIFINFFVGFHSEEGLFVSKRGMIACHYLTTWFLVDLVSTVPMDAIVPLMLPTTTASAYRSLKLVRVLRLARLLKLLRMFKLRTLFFKMEHLWFMNPAVLRLWRLLLEAVFVAHVLACGWHLIPEMEQAGESWYDTAGIYVSTTSATRYLKSLYWVSTTMTAVGFGDVHATTGTERLFSILTQVVGVIFFGFLVASISSLLDTMNMRAALLRDKMMEVKEYLYDRKLPKQLQRRILGFYRHLYSKRSMFNELDILNELSDSLRNEILFHSRADLVAQIKVFRKLEPPIVAQLLMRMRPAAVVAGEMLTSSGAAEELFICTDGIVEGVIARPTPASQLTATPKGRHKHVPHYDVVSVYMQGDMFGYVDLLMSRPRQLMFRALMAGEVHIVAKDALEEVIQLFPQFHDQLHADAQQESELLQRAMSAVRSRYANPGRYAYATLPVVHAGKLESRTEIPGYLPARKAASRAMSQARSSRHSAWAASTRRLNKLLHGSSEGDLLNQPPSLRRLGSVGGTSGVLRVRVKAKKMTKSSKQIMRKLRVSGLGATLEVADEGADGGSPKQASTSLPSFVAAASAAGAASKSTSPVHAMRSEGSSKMSEARGAIASNGTVHSADSDIAAAMLSRLAASSGSTPGAPMEVSDFGLEDGDSSGRSLDQPGSTHAANDSKSASATFSLSSLRSTSNSRRVVPISLLSGGNGEPARTPSEVIMSSHGTASTAFKPSSAGPGAGQGIVLSGFGGSSQRVVSQPGSPSSRQRAEAVTPPGRAEASKRGSQLMAGDSKLDSGSGPAGNSRSDEDSVSMKHLNGFVAGAGAGVGNGIGSGQGQAQGQGQEQGSGRSIGSGHSGNGTGSGAGTGNGSASANASGQTMGGVASMPASASFSKKISANSKRLDTDGERLVLEGVLEDATLSQRQLLMHALVSTTSRFKYLWDTIMVLMALTSICITPFRLAFSKSKSAPWESLGLVELVFDGIYVLDILLQFRTTYISSIGEVEVGVPSLIAKVYLGSMFWWDLASTVPLELGIFAITGSHGNTIALCRVLRLCKLKRVGSLSHVYDSLMCGRSLPPAASRLIMLLFEVTYTAHLLGCMWFLAARISSEDGARHGNWWAAVGTSVPHALDTPRDAYIAALYWSFTTITTVGYGDILPQSNTELIFALFVVLIGATVFAFIVGTLTAMVGKLDSAAQRHNERMNEIRQYLREMNATQDMFHRINRFYEHLFSVKSVYDEEQIMAELPPSLRNQVILALNKDIIKRIPFFQNQDDAFTAHVARLLRPQLYRPGEAVVNEGDSGLDMYFLIRGKASVESVSAATGEVVTHVILKDGDYFGELAMLVNCKRTATVRAKTTLSVFALGKDAIGAMLAQFPTLAPMMQQAMEHASKRLKKRRMGEVKQRILAERYGKLWMQKTFGEQGPGSSRQQAASVRRVVPPHFSRRSGRSLSTRSMVSVNSMASATSDTDASSIGGAAAYGHGPAVHSHVALDSIMRNAFASSPRFATAPDNMPSPVAEEHRLRHVGSAASGVELGSQLSALGDSMDHESKLEDVGDVEL